MQKKKIKRLYFDIETSPAKGFFWRPGWKVKISYDNIEEPAKVICVSWKWEGEDEVHNIHWTKSRDDKRVIKKFIEILDEADEIVAHNGKRFDLPWIRSRAVVHGLDMRPYYTITDTLKLARYYFNFPSNKLDDLGDYLGVGRKTPHEGFGLWKKVYYGDSKALQDMLDYCDNDVVLLEKVFAKLKNYMAPTTHHGRLQDENSEKYQCPDCSTDHVHCNKTRTTAAGTLKHEMKCKDKSCGRSYTISHTAYLKYLVDKLKNS